MGKWKRLKICFVLFSPWVFALMLWLQNWYSSHPVSINHCFSVPIIPWWSYQQSRIDEGTPEYLEVFLGTFSLDVAAQFAFLYCSLRLVILNLDVISGSKACQSDCSGLGCDHLPTTSRPVLAWPWRNKCKVFLKYNSEDWWMDIVQAKEMLIHWLHGCHSRFGKLKRKT